MLFHGDGHTSGNEAISARYHKVTKEQEGQRIAGNGSVAPAVKVKKTGMDEAKSIPSTAGRGRHYMRCDVRHAANIGGHSNHSSSALGAAWCSPAARSLQMRRGSHNRSTPQTKHESFFSELFIFFFRKRSERAADQHITGSGYRPEQTAGRDGSQQSMTRLNPTKTPGKKEKGPPPLPILLMPCPEPLPQPSKPNTTG